MLPLTRTDLYNANDVLLQSTDASVRAEELVKRKERSGWLLTLEAGEKVLAKSLIVEGRAYMSVYNATHTNIDCTIPDSQNKILAVSLFDAGPSNFLTTDPTPSDTNPTHADRFEELNTQGIAGEPQVIFAAGAENAQLFVGNENVGDLGTELQLVLWHGR